MGRQWKSMEMAPHKQAFTSADWRVVGQVGPGLGWFEPRVSAMDLTWNSNCLLIGLEMSAPTQPFKELINANPIYITGISFLKELLSLHIYLLLKCSQ